MQRSSTLIDAKRQSLETSPEFWLEPGSHFNELKHDGVYYYRDG